MNRLCRTLLGAALAAGMLLALNGCTPTVVEDRKPDTTVVTPPSQPHTTVVGATVVPPPTETTRKRCPSLVTSRRLRMVKSRLTGALNRIFGKPNFGGFPPTPGSTETDMTFRLLSR